MTDYAVLILAGGLGTRLRNAVADRQKVVSTVAGEPFLCHILRQIAATHIPDVILCVGHQAATVKEQLKKFCPDFPVKYSEEEYPLGTAGALRQALEVTTANNFLVMNGDSFLDTSLSDFICWRETQKLPAALLLTEVADTSRYGKVILSEQGQVLSFAEKGFCIGPGLINAGIYILTRNILLTLPPKQKHSLEMELFPSLVEQKQLYGLFAQKHFIDIGTPDSYQEAQQFFIANQ